MKASEARRFAQQAELNQQRIDEFRRAARETKDTDQRHLLETAADAIETTATEWADLVNELAQG